MAVNVLTNISYHILVVVVVVVVVVVSTARLQAGVNTQNNTQ